MRLFKKMEKQQITIALFDNNMKIVKPVYDYLNYLKIKRREPNTIIAYGTDLKLYWDYLHYKGLEYSQVTPNMIDGFIEYLREPYHDKDVTHIYNESERCGKTINRILKTVYNFYKYQATILNIYNPILTHEVNRPFSMDKGKLDHTRKDNKVETLSQKVNEEEEDFNILSEEEAEVFLSYLKSKRDKLLFKIMYYSGMRISEALALRIENIPLPDNTQTVASFTITSHEDDSLDQQHKTGSRTVYIPMKLLNEIDKFIMDERYKIDTKHSYIFVSEQKQWLGKPLTRSAVYQKYKLISEKTGIEMTPHTLRHTCCTNLIAGGIDVSVAKKIMGHKHISTTMKYTHLASKFIKEKLDEYWKVSNLIGGGLNVK